MSLEGDSPDHSIRQAIADGRIIPQLQPIVSMRTGETAGWEALSRFPTLKVQVEEVFAAARIAGLSLELDVACLEACLALLPRIPPGRFLSVNVLPDTVTAQSRLRLGPDVLRCLDEGRSLMLEISETAEIEDFLPLRSPLHRMREQGITIAINDVGKGTSGLYRLVMTNPDVLKIDANLVRGIDENPAKQSIIATLASFARQRRTRIVAEGIEHQAEQDWLVDMGIDFGQGFLFGRPTPVDDTPGVLAA